MVVKSSNILSYASSTVSASPHATHTLNSPPASSQLTSLTRYFFSAPLTPAFSHLPSFVLNFVASDVGNAWNAKYWVGAEVARVEVMRC